MLPLEEIAVDPAAEADAQIQSLQVQGANVIYNQSLSFTPVKVLAALARLGARDDFVVGGVNWTFNTDVLGTLAAVGILEAADGYYGVFPSGWWDDDGEGISAIAEVFDAGGYPDADRAVAYLLGYATIDAVAQILEQTVDRVGYENLSGETFFDTFKEIGLIDAGPGALTFDVRDGRRASGRAQIRQWQLQDDGTVEFAVVQDFFDLPDTRP